MHLGRRVFVVALLTIASTRASHAAVTLIEDTSAPLAPARAQARDGVIGGAGAFPLVAGGLAADIVVPPDAPEVVKIAARDLASDVAAVSGVMPRIVVDAPASAPASARASARTSAPAPGDRNRPRVELVLASSQGRLAGRWEAFRISASADVLTIAGSDRRGLAYGVYEISRRIGVSPWHWWADVPVRHRAQVRLSLGEEAIDEPAVHYRGIFINDEDWGLQPWAARTFEPAPAGVGNIGPRTYARVFELLLRLRGNCLWTAMHPTTTAFFMVPGNAAVADKYAIVVGSSHAEPMLRNNVGEWKLAGGDYNYLTHRDEVLKYWEARVKERAGAGGSGGVKGESLFTLGMRGIHDSPIVGPTTQAQRIATLERIFADQRGLLARYLGDGDATRVPQIFVPYKEVLDDYDAGLIVPDDVTLVWPDDNYAYVRRFATAAERKRSGGLGVYYHASYSGMPQSWLWIDTLPPALMWSEMGRAYEQGARRFWIVNVGDIKNTERSCEFFLDLAWHARDWAADVNAPGRFLHETAARDFGKENADAIADVLARLQAINFERKTEHLQWHLSLTPYQPTELNEAEIHRRLERCAELLRDSDAIARRLPAGAGEAGEAEEARGARDAYFELVGYPVGITAAANERYFYAELARADVARGRSADADRAAAAAAAGEKRVDELTTRYNNEIAGGKWRNIVSENGYAPGAWPRFQRDTKTPRPQPAEDNVCPPAPPEPGELPPPADARPGDFVEREKMVSILAGHFSGRKDLPDGEGAGGGWRVIPALGRSGCAVTVLPSTAKIPLVGEGAGVGGVVGAGAPSLDYRFNIATGGRTKIQVRLLPTYPIVPGRGLRFAVAIDDGAAIPLAVTSGFDSNAKKSDPRMTEWQRRVLANATYATADLPKPLEAGWHTLRLIAVDAGVVIDKIVLDLGGLHPSYDGPPETRVP